MATSETEAHQSGYLKAVEALFDEALAPTPKERAEARRKRQELESSFDDPDAYRSVRAALDKADDGFWMQRSTAQFYLRMSPTTFKKALGRGPHPFEAPNGGAMKKDVLGWFEGAVTAKHADKVGISPVARMGRDSKSGRPYLVRDDGVILADGEITSLSREDVLQALETGGDLRVMTLSKAMASPWASNGEWLPWADGNIRMLQARVRNAADVLDQAREEAAKAKEAKLEAVWAAAPSRRPPPF